MGITDFALNNSRTVIMLQVLIVGLGLCLFPNFPKLEDPPIIIREALVSAQYPGMPPDRIERLITRPIEEEIQTMGEVKDIKNSQSKFGESIIHVVIKDEVPSSELPAVWKHLRNKMSDVSRKLPDGTIGPFVNDEFGDTAVATIALWSDGFSMEEMREVARATRERLAKLKGLKKIDLYGVQEERIYLDISDSKLKALGIDPSEIGQALREQNVIIPGGKLNINDMELIVEPSGQFKTVDGIGELLVHFKNTEGKESSIRLKDVATVKKGYVDPVYQPAYFNGRQSIVLAVYMLDGYNAVSFGEALQKQLDRIQRSLPLGYKFDFATYQPYLINKAVNNMVLNVIESLVIVLVVVMLFLGLRTGLIVGFFIPLVMLSGVVGMWILGISMQRMSLAAMIIALGMLVDNGICVAEEITTRMQEGASARDATLTTGRLLAVPLLTSTLTTVFAFCPILLQAGGAGDYTKSLGIVIAMLLLSSWFLSMFSTTTACSWFVKVKAQEKSTGQTSCMDKFYSFYKWILEFFLAHRLAVVVAVVAVMALSAYGFTFVPITFFPPGDRNQYLIYLDFPAGTRIEETDKTIKGISSWLQNKKANPEITGAIAYVGNGGPRFFLSLAPDDPDSNYGFIIVNTQNNQQVPLVIDRTRNHLLDYFPNVRARVKAMWLGSSETGLFEIRLSGPDIDTLEKQADEIQAALRNIPGSIDIRQDWNNRRINMLVNVDQNRARRAGVTTKEVGNSLDIFINGRKLSDFYYGYTNIPIVVRGEEKERTSMDQLYTLGIYSKTTKENIPLSQIADIRAKGDFDRIKRHNQERTITVSAKNKTLAASQIFQKLKPKIDTMKFPENHYWELGGELEKSIEAQGNLFKWIPVCFGALIALLVWQFNSFRRAAIITITIPLVAIGGILGLLVMNADFGFMVLLGFLSLAGAIVNNGIVLIDRIEYYRENDTKPYDAIVKAALNRFRPIFLSVSTTILGLSPLIFSHDPLFYGMACLMVFGLGVGTVFTLGVVPVLYSLFFRIRKATV